MKKFKVFFIVFVFFSQSLLAQNVLIKSYTNFLEKVDARYLSTLTKITVQEIQKTIKEPETLLADIGQVMTFKNDKEKQALLQEIVSFQKFKASQTGETEILLTAPREKKIQISLSELGKGVLLVNGTELPYSDALNYSKLLKFVHSSTVRTSVPERVLNFFIPSAHSAVFSTLLMLTLLGATIYSLDKGINKAIDFEDKALGERNLRVQEYFEKKFKAAINTCERDQAVVSQARKDGLNALDKTHTYIFIEELERLSKKLDNNAGNLKPESSALISCETVKLIDTRNDDSTKDRGTRASSFKVMNLADQPIFRRVGKACAHIEELKKCLEETEKKLAESTIPINDNPRGANPIESKDYQDTPYPQIIRDIEGNGAAR